MKYPLPTQILLDAAHGLKAETKIIDKKTAYLTQVKYRGKKKYFGIVNIPKFPLNDAVALNLAKDKAFSYLVLKEEGLKIPRGDHFFNLNSPYFQSLKKEEPKRYASFIKYGIKEALKFAEKLGYPVFVKPNRSSGGKLCQKIYNKTQLKKIINEVFKIDYIVIIQKPISWPEYRIVVLDNKILLTYQKIAPSVVGDGKSMISHLIRQKYSTDFLIDETIKERLKKSKLTLKFIPQKNIKITLKDSANLKTGGEIVNEFKKMSPSLKKLVKKISKTIGLRLYGLDLMTPDINSLQKYCIIEINGNPSFSEYYLQSPKKTTALYQTLIKTSLR